MPQTAKKTTREEQKTGGRRAKAPDRRERRESDAQLLAMWQERAELARKETAELRELMERREALYRGSRDIDVVGRGGQLSSGAPAAAATVVRNIVAECVESLVDSSIPQPKVTARRKEDEPLAALVEAASGGKYGARDLRRTIRRQVEDPLAERLLQGTLGTAVTLDAEDGKPVLR